MIRPDYEYELARNVIHKLKPVLAKQFIGKIPEENYMMLWDIVFDIIDTIDKDVDTVQYCCMRQEMMGECDCE